MANTNICQMCVEPAGFYNKTTRPNGGSSDQGLWNGRPFRENGVKVLRKSKVQEHKHTHQKDKHLQPKRKQGSSSKKDSLVHKTKRKGSHLHTIVKGTKKTKQGSSSKKDSLVHKTKRKGIHLHTIVKGTKKTKQFTSSVKSEPSDVKIKQEQAKSRSELLTEKQIQPELKKVYSGDDADILEGDDEEDDNVFYSRGTCLLPKTKTVALFHLFIRLYLFIYLFVQEHLVLFTIRIELL